MSAKFYILAAALLTLVSCGVSSNIGSDQTDGTEKVKVKRGTMYSSLAEFIRLRCTMPPKGVSSVNAGSSGRLYIVDGNQGSSTVPLQMIYSIKILDPSSYGAYGFRA